MSEELDSDFGWYTAEEANGRYSGLLCNDCIKLTGKAPLRGASEDGRPYAELRCADCGTLVLPALCLVCEAPCRCLDYAEAEDNGPGGWALCSCWHRAAEIDAQDAADHEWDALAAWDVPEFAAAGIGPGPAEE